MFKLAIITDEVSQELDTVIAFARQFSLQGLEIRSLWDRGPFDLTGEDVRRIREKTQAAGLTVCCIGSPFFKCDIDDEAAIRAHMEGLRRCCGMAHQLGAGLIRGFSFWKKPGLSLEQIAGRLQPAMELMQREQLTLVLEPDPAVNTPNGRTLAALLRLLPGQAGALWDPGNIPFDDAGEIPYPDGFEAVRSRLRHVHLKDSRRENGVPMVVPVGEGVVDMKGQLGRLLAEGYDGWVSLETHYRLNRTLSEESLRLPGGGGFSDGGWEASADCMERLRRMLGELPQ